MATTAKELPGDTGSQDMLVQFNLSTECNLCTLPDSLVMKSYARELISTIYFLAWLFFSLQQAKTCKVSRIYSSCHHGKCKHINISNLLYMSDVIH